MPPHLSHALPARAAGVRRLAVLAYRAIAQAAHDLLVVDVEREHRVDLRRDSVRASSPSPSACGTVRTTPSRITPVRVLRLRQLLAMMPRMTESGTRSPRSMYDLRLEAERRAGAARGAKHVAGGERRNVERLGEQRRLRALSGAGFPKRTMIMWSRSLGARH